MKSRKLLALVALIAACALLAGCGGGSETASKTRSLTNVSYDPTREFYSAYNALFAKYWLDKTGETVEITQSHGGSGSQALSVAQGLEADVVTLALEGDVQAVADAGLIDAGWIDELPKNAAPYTSTIVFLVRKGNPKNLRDWDDLAQPGVGVITPNPKTSGGARWNFLAAWAYGEAHLKDEAEIEAFIGALFGNVLVLDAGARGSTTSFVENKQGDVLLAWENEAFLTLKQYPDEYEIVAPSVSILCQPSVAVVDAVAKQRGTETLAHEYLARLYEPDAQELAASYYYRPSDEAILKAHADTFDLSITMTNIEHFGGWKEAQAKYFADGGVFDRIYEK